MNYSKLERNIATEKQFLKSQTCPPSLPLLGIGCLLFLVCTTFNETGFRTDFKKSFGHKKHTSLLYFSRYFIHRENWATSADYVQSLWTITKKTFAR